VVKFLEELLVYVDHKKRTKNVAKSEKVDIAINTEKEETKD
jgi:hypothetical protein